MDFVAFLQEKFSKVGAVLSGNASDEGFHKDTRLRLRLRSSIWFAAPVTI
jgi:hypothetical protein